MDVGNGLLIFLLMLLIFSFVALLITMLASCCDESLGNDTDPSAIIIAASLNSRLNRQTSHYRFRYDIPYDANERRQVVTDSDFELPSSRNRYGYSLPSPTDHLNVSPLSRAASYRSTNSSNYVHLPPVSEAEPRSFTDTAIVDPSEEPPPSYDEIVGRASSYI